MVNHNKNGERHTIKGRETKVDFQIKRGGDGSFDRQWMSIDDSRVLVNFTKKLAKKRFGIMGSVLESFPYRKMVSRKLSESTYFARPVREKESTGNDIKRKFKVEARFESHTGRSSRGRRRKAGPWIIFTGKRAKCEETSPGKKVSWLVSPRRGLPWMPTGRDRWGEGAAKKKMLRKGPWPKGRLGLSAVNLRRW